MIRVTIMPLPQLEQRRRGIGYLIWLVGCDAYTEIPSFRTPPHNKYCAAIAMKLFNIAHFHRSRLRRLVEPTGALGSIMISGAQIRAARGLLGWTRYDLARRAVVSDATAYALENDRGSAANPSTLSAVQSTLETAGIEFLDGPAPGHL
jgi:DNA-binding XRE family transcriptional regulator